jgi:lysophospholipid acyltransferase (LPLAT)-like uncharacterized protein
MNRFQNFFLFQIAVPLIVFIFKLIGKTYKFKEIGKFDVSPYNPQKKENYIFGFWHCQLVGIIYFYQNFNIASIASLHRDGEIAARAAEKFGIKIVRGSSTRGGFKAFMDLKKYIEQGYDIAITVDGPRGPAETVNDGILYMAKITGKKIVPACFVCDKKVRLKSWDKLIIPLPFSNGFFAFGKPIEIPSGIDDTELEKFRDILKQELLEINKNCEKYLYGNKL